MFDKKAWRIQRRKQINAYHYRWHLKRHYGLTSEELSQMKRYQRNRCAICRKKPYRLVVDHNHKTGKVRGLLCDLCNKGIGSLFDNPRIVQSAFQYLRKDA
jgi:hypothetical protein